MGSGEAALTALRLYMLFDKARRGDRRSKTIEQKILDALAPIISVVLSCKIVMSCEPSVPVADGGINPSPSKNDFLFTRIQDRIRECSAVRGGVLRDKERVREVFIICERTFLQRVDYRGIIVKIEALLELREYLCSAIVCEKLPQNSIFARIFQALDHMILVISAATSVR